VQKFWNDNNNLLVNAWAEWDEETKGSIAFSAEELLDSKLRDAIYEAWKNPE